MGRKQVATEPVPRIALTPSEAAASLGVSVDYFTENIGYELRWVRRGRKKLVAITELQRSGAPPERALISTALPSRSRRRRSPQCRP